MKQQFKQPIWIRQWVKRSADTTKRWLQPPDFSSKLYSVPPKWSYFTHHPQVYKNLVFPKLPCHLLCLISSKETAQASLNLWMIHPNRTDKTQRQAVKWTVFYEPMYDVYISYDISSEAFPMCLQDPSVSLRADFKIFHFNLLKVNANTIFWCVIITTLDNISFHIKV